MKIYQPLEGKPLLKCRANFVIPELLAFAVDPEPLAQVLWCRDVIARKDVQPDLVDAEKSVESVSLSGNTQANSSSAEPIMC
jgi:hypothetical protein